VIFNVQKLILARFFIQFGSTFFLLPPRHTKLLPFAKKRHNINYRRNLRASRIKISSISLVQCHLSLFVFVVGCKLQAASIKVSNFLLDLFSLTCLRLNCVLRKKKSLLLSQNISVPRSTTSIKHKTQHQSYR